VLKTAVRKVRPASGGNGLRWEIETDRDSWRSAIVVVATGHHCEPVPLEAGAFGGEFMYAVHYRKGDPFAGRHVLIVGAGNTGTEIAMDVAGHGAAFVAISVRTPPPVVPRDFLGTPVQVFGVLMSSLPPRVADRIGAVLARIATGDLRRYGLGRPAWRPFTARRIPVIDVGFVRALKEGSVEVRPAVTGFTPDGVIYAGGGSEPFDVVIAATGYRTGLDRLLDAPGVLDETGYPVHPQGHRTSQPGLYFLGYTRSHRGHLFEANRASRRLAKIVAEELRGVKIGS
jgi:putative flavoprotein involved in K+ transport